MIHIAILRIDLSFKTVQLSPPTLNNFPVLVPKYLGFILKKNKVLAGQNHGLGVNLNNNCPKGIHS